jgi:hypothetical protein
MVKGLLLAHLGCLVEHEGRGLVAVTGAQVDGGESAAGRAEGIGTYRRDGRPVILIRFLPPT